MAVEAPLYPPPLFVFPVPVPTAGIEFSKVYRATGSPSNLVTATNYREAVCALIASKPSSAGPIVSAIEQYIPYLLSLRNVVLTDADLRMDAPLDSTWTSGLSKKKAKKFSAGSIHFEVILTLSALAFVKMNEAAALIDSVTWQSGNVEAITSGGHAASLLKEAAGIFDFISDNDMKLWTNRPYERPLEVVDKVPEAMSALCLAQAQGITVAVGQLKGTGGSVLAKLSVDSAQKFEGVHASLTRLEADQSELSSELLTFVQSAGAAFKGLATRLVAEQTYAQGSIGHAIGYVNLATKILTLAHVSSPSCEGLKSLKVFADGQMEAVNGLSRQYKLDNDMVYFEKVVTDEDALVLPQAISLAKASGYVQPQSVFTAI